MWQKVLQADQYGINRGLTAASSTQIAAAGLRLRGHESGWGPTSTEVMSNFSADRANPDGQVMSPFLWVLFSLFLLWDAREPSLFECFSLLCVVFSLEW